MIELKSYCALAICSSGVCCVTSDARVFKLCQINQLLFRYCVLHCPYSAAMSTNVKLIDVVWKSQLLRSFSGLCPLSKGVFRSFFTAKTPAVGSSCLYRIFQGKSCRFSSHVKSQIVTSGNPKWSHC